MLCEERLGPIATAESYGIYFSALTNCIDWNGINIANCHSGRDSQDSITVQCHTPVLSPTAPLLVRTLANHDVHVPNIWVISSTDELGAVPAAPQLATFS